MEIQKDCCDTYTPLPQMKLMEFNPTVRPVMPSLQVTLHSSCTAVISHFQFAELRPKIHPHSRGFVAAACFEQSQPSL